MILITASTAAATTDMIPVTFLSVIIALIPVNKFITPPIINIIGNSHLLLSVLINAITARTTTPTPRSTLRISRIVLIILMFMGRVGGLTLIYAAFSGNGNSYSKFPEEKINIG